MEQENRSGVVKVSDLPRIRSQQFVSGYTNHIEATQSFFDIRLVMCQITRILSEDAGPKLVVEEQATFAMTWEHAAQVRDLLDRIISQYEKQNGPLRQQKDRLEETEE